MNDRHFEHSPQTEIQNTHHMNQSLYKLLWRITMCMPMSLLYTSKSKKMCANIIQYILICIFILYFYCLQVTSCKRYKHYTFIGISEYPVIFMNNCILFHTVAWSSVTKAQLSFTICWKLETHLMENIANCKQCSSAKYKCYDKIKYIKLR